MTHSHDAGGASGQKMNIVQYGWMHMESGAHNGAERAWKGCVALAQVIENAQEGWNT